jgi:hypothetical protein
MKRLVGPLQVLLTCEAKSTDYEKYAKLFYQSDKRHRIRLKLMH